jgi:hypothetical protein
MQIFRFNDMKSGKYIVWILLFIPSILSAQNDEKISSQEMNRLFKPQYHFNIGSSYSYFPSFGGGMNMFASPSVSIPLSKRIFVEGGIIASTSIIPGLSPLEINHSVNNFNSLAIYGSTIYQITPKLSVYGTGIKQLMNTKLPYPYSSLNQNSFSVGSTFKLGNNITIGASINMSDKSNFYSPFHPGSAGIMNSPIFW